MGPLPNTHVTCHTWHVKHHMSHINIFCSPIQVGCLKVCIQCIPRTIVYVMRIIHWHVGLLWAPAGGQWEDRDWHFSLPRLTSEFRSSPCLGSSRLLARKFEIWTEEIFLSDKILFSHDRRCVSQYPRHQPPTNWSSYQCIIWIIAKCPNYTDFFLYSKISLLNLELQD